MAKEIRIHAEDGGRFVGADFFTRLDGATGTETLKTPATVTVVRVTKGFGGTTRTDVTADFFDGAEPAQVVQRSVVTPAATDRPADLLGVVRKLREPVPGARPDASYEIRFEATVDIADEPTENVVGTLLVDQTGRPG